MMHFIHAHWIIAFIWLIIGIFMAGFEIQKSEIHDKNKKQKGEPTKEYTAGVRLLASMIIACAGPITLIANFGGWCYRRYNRGGNKRRMLC